MLPNPLYKYVTMHVIKLEFSGFNFPSSGGRISQEEIRRTDIGIEVLMYSEKARPDVNIIGALHF